MNRSVHRNRVRRNVLLTVVCRCLFSLAITVFGSVFANAEDPPSDSGLSSRPRYQALQQALDTLARAEITVEEANLSGSQDQELVRARQQCREAITKLQHLETVFAERLRATYRIRPSQRPKNSWTLRELESLGRNLKVQLARAYRNQALCYGEGSIDRLNSLSLALQQLPDVTMQPIDDASVWRARVEQIVCLRLINRLADAEQLITQRQAESPPVAIASRLLGERLRLALARQEIQQARLLATEIQNGVQPQAPETDDAVLECILTTQSDAQSRALRDALIQLRRITATHGPFWQRRAEMRIGRAMTEQLDSDDPELLGFAAASLYAARKSTEAIATYRRLAELHSNAGRADQEFTAIETVAAILRSTGQIAEALHEFRSLAKENPTHTRAASNHLIAIGLSAQLTEQASETQRATAFENYLELLGEHLQLWPEQPTTQQVRQWLDDAKLPDIDRRRAKMLAAQGNRDEALALYRSLLPDFPDDADLLEEYATLLAESNDNTDQREALRLWQQIEKRSKPGGPRWRRGRRARLTLLRQLGRQQEAEKLQRLTKILHP